VIRSVVQVALGALVIAAVIAIANGGAGSLVVALTALELRHLRHVPGRVWRTVRRPHSPP